MADTEGNVVLRAENVSAVVTGFALQAYKMKQLCMINPSSSWIETYFRETKAELTGGTSEAVRGVPRLAAFPHGEVSWTRVQSYIEKYGMQGTISIEDELTSSIDVIAREFLRIGRAVANAVDIQVESAINSATGKNSVAIAVGNAWDSDTIANRDPIFDVLQAEREIFIDNYDILDGNGYLCLSPTDYTNLLRNTKVINNPSFKSSEVIANGVVGQICGLKIIVSNVITASQAYVVKAKEAITWKQAQPLKVITIDDPGIKKTIRAFELGVAQVTNPEAICEITGTQK